MAGWWLLNKMNGPDFKKKLMGNFSTIAGRTGKTGWRVDPL
jgi:hypothetical protein